MKQSRRLAVVGFALWLSLAIMNPSPVATAAPGFQAIGEFSLRSLDGGRYEISDGLGRVLHLVPRGQKPPPGVPRHEIIPIPVRKVIMTGGRDVSMLLALDSIGVLVGVDGKTADWKIGQVRDGLKEGRIVNVGRSHSLDYEQIAALKPDVLFTWDEAQIPFLADLGIPVVINYGTEARTLETQINFVRFLAPFVGKEQMAEAYVARVKAALDKIAQRAKNVPSRPKVIWGDVWEKRVMVEPGQSWAAQLVDLAGGEYLFKDVRGSSCLEISLERFYSAAKQADVMFTYRSPESGMASKADLARTNPALAGAKPMASGRVYFPLPEYNQSGHRMDEVIEEIAAILQPQFFPERRITLFHTLPEN
ncbi:MAG: ABC transporter substrate-binding protein [Thermodesulfobacteriota bacterium]